MSCEQYINDKYKLPAKKKIETHTRRIITKKNEINIEIVVSRKLEHKQSDTKSNSNTYHNVSASVRIKVKIVLIWSFV